LLDVDGAAADVGAFALGGVSKVGFEKVSDGGVASYGDEPWLKINLLD